MIFVMLINLYVVRAVLDILGVEDYGIFNVVGGVVLMFSFLNGTLAAASQRFFSIELANGSIKSLNKSFALNLTVFLVITIICVIILETIGLWFLNTQMIIPENRMFAANVVYQFSIAAFVFQMLAVPYTAFVIAYEKMSAFAYIGIIEAVAKLGIVAILTHLNYDKLILYGGLTCLLSISVTLSYYVYCKNKLQGCDYYVYWNKQEAKRLISFSGWHFYGTFSGVISGQGINILINMFFNPTVNAARAIAYQVNNAVMQLYNNFFIAVKPQMYKSYANNEIEALNLLIFRSTIVSFFLVSVVALPFIINVDFVLGVWLKEVPEDAGLFTCLVLLASIFESTNGSIICPVLATGRIKSFYIWTSLLYILNLPISYVFLKLGFEASSTMLVAAIIAFISIYIRALLLNKLITFHLRKYCIIVNKLLFFSVLIFALLHYCAYVFENSIVSLLFTCFISVILHILLYYYFLLEKSEKEVIKSFIFKRLK